jgi:PAS domain S-box-containing protein
MNSDSFGSRSLSEGLWDWNLVSNRIHFSRGWLALVGCDEHEVGTTQQAWFQRLHPEDLPEVSQTVDAALADGPDAIELRHRMLHQDGSYRWMACRAVVQRNADGRAVRVSGCHTDVTADSITDSLTGLPNQLLLVDRVTRSIERARRYPGFTSRCWWSDSNGRTSRAVGSRGTPS